MSAIGPISMSGVHLAGSVAGLQTSGANRDRASAESADRSFQISRDALQARATEDVSEAELSADRDADGRMMWSGDEQPGEADGEPRTAGDAAKAAGESASASRRAPDAFGESGTLLDLEA